MTERGEQLLVKFLHDPVDKCFDVKGHERRAQKYAEKLGISLDKDIYRGADILASILERLLLPNYENLHYPFKEIIHPFSAYKIKIPEGLNVAQMQAAVKQAFSVANNLPDNYHKFLFLYFLLENLLVKKIQDLELKKIIPLLPADTRIPDHSIWEHLKITCAVNAYKDRDKIYQNNSLLVFTLGPVQSFIKQARKVQDFYAGSYLLSYLTFKAMEVVINKYSPANIIYPDLKGQPFALEWLLRKDINMETTFEIDTNLCSDLIVPTIPNRFVAIIPESDSDEIKRLGAELIKSVKQELAGIMSFIKSYLENRKFELKSWSLWEDQITKYFNAYWAALPWNLGARDITLDDLKGWIPERILNKYRKRIDFVAKSEDYAVKYSDMFKTNVSLQVGLIYDLLYGLLERALGMRKSIRDFEQICEQGPKCHVCGERNRLLERDANGTVYEYEYDCVDGVWQFKNKREIHYNDEGYKNGEVLIYKHLQKRESLCAVCFIKRILHEYLYEKYRKIYCERFRDLRYPSTAEVAIADWKYSILQLPDGDKVKNNYLQINRLIISMIKEIRKCNASIVTEPLPLVQKTLGERYDLEGWLIMEEYYKEFCEAWKPCERKISANTIKNCWNLLQEIKKNHYVDIFPYYAVIAMDGDEMGKWIQGEKLPDVEQLYVEELWKGFSDDFKNGLKKCYAFCGKRPISPAVHASISTALKNFSLGLAIPIVEHQYLGKVVYAGGDDVLAFLNLRDLLPIIRTLRAAYSGCVKVENDKITVDWTNKSGFVLKDGRYLLTMGPTATASMGIVIAHYKTPLRRVLDMVFELEKKAKSAGRDRFSVGIIKHSGSVEVSTLPWLFNNWSNTFDVVEILSEIVGLFSEAEGVVLSPKFISDLEKEFQWLKRIKLKDKLEQMVEIEIKRLVRRHIKINDKLDDNDAKGALIRSVIEKLLVLLKASEHDFENFINVLRIARFLSRRYLKRTRHAVKSAI